MVSNMKLLHIDSSINGDNSVSRKLSKTITEQLVAAFPEAQVDYLDLAVNAPNHFSANAMAFRNPEANDPSAEEVKRENAVSEQLVTQFLESDVIVVAAPFYNFTIPSQLKAWIDRILQPRRTFRYTENGVEGLATGKTVVVASSRGGVYSTTEQGQALEHQESYLKTIFAFIGITDVHIVRAEGVAVDPEAVNNALTAAKAQVQEISQQVAA